MPEPDELVPEDIAAWIDERDPEPLDDADATAQERLEEQRREHEQEGGPDRSVADDGVAPIVNNTGQDGGAATG